MIGLLSSELADKLSLQALEGLVRSSWFHLPDDIGGCLPPVCVMSHSDYNDPYRIENCEVIFRVDQMLLKNMRYPDLVPTDSVEEFRIPTGSPIVFFPHYNDPWTEPPALRPIEDFAYYHSGRSVTHNGQMMRIGYSGLRRIMEESDFVVWSPRAFPVQESPVTMHNFLEGIWAAHPLLAIEKDIVAPGRQYMGDTGFEDLVRRGTAMTFQSQEDMVSYIQGNLAEYPPEIYRERKKRRERQRQKARMHIDAWRQEHMPRILSAIDMLEEPGCMQSRMDALYEIFDRGYEIYCEKRGAEVYTVLHKDTYWTQRDAR